MAAAAIGLTPIFPPMAVVPVVVIPAFARSTKLLAEPRLTALRIITIGGVVAVVVLVVTVVGITEFRIELAINVTAVFAKAFPVRAAPELNTIAVPANKLPLTIEFEPSVA